MHVCTCTYVPCSRERTVESALCISDSLKARSACKSCNWAGEGMCFDWTRVCKGWEEWEEKEGGGEMGHNKPDTYKVHRCSVSQQAGKSGLCAHMSLSHLTDGGHLLHNGTFQLLPLVRLRSKGSIKAFQKLYKVAAKHASRAALDTTTTPPLCHQ